MYGSTQRRNNFFVERALCSGKGAVREGLPLPSATGTWQAVKQETNPGPGAPQEHCPSCSAIKMSLLGWIPHTHDTGYGWDRVFTESPFGK